MDRRGTRGHMSRWRRRISKITSIKHSDRKGSNVLCWLLCSGSLDGRAAACGSSLAGSSRSLFREIAFLGRSLEDIIGRVRGQRLNPHQFPALLAQGIEIAARKRAAPLVSNQGLKSLAGNPPAIIDICYFIRPLRHFCSPSRRAITLQSAYACKHFIVRWLLRFLLARLNDIISDDTSA